MGKALECVCPCHRKGMACPFACCGPGYVTSAIEGDGKRIKTMENRFQKDFERIFETDDSDPLRHIKRRGYR